MADISIEDDLVEMSVKEFEKLLGYAEFVLDVQTGAHAKNADKFLEPMRALLKKDLVSCAHCKRDDLSEDEAVFLDIKHVVLKSRKGQLNNTNKLYRLYFCTVTHRDTWLKEVPKEKA